MEENIPKPLTHMQAILPHSHTSKKIKTAKVTSIYNLPSPFFFKYENNYLFKDFIILSYAFQARRTTSLEIMELVLNIETAIDNKE